VTETVSAPPYDGIHLIADLHDCGAALDNVALIDRTVRDAVAAVGATLIGMNLHHFGPGQGVTGVAVLAESHVSIHTWPEHRYAAIDIFLCGRRHDPALALDVIATALQSVRIVSQSIPRGFGAAGG
jgi:S-adenosylmethionine decarboxylase